MTDPKVIHYNKPGKPWELSRDSDQWGGRSHPLNKLWWQIYELETGTSPDKAHPSEDA
jgi:hypothetical protein